MISPTDLRLEPPATSHTRRGTGSDAYLSVNVGSGTPQESSEWLEYQNEVFDYFHKIRQRTVRAQLPVCHSKKLNGASRSRTAIV
jgi:hypothetical protein